jgi:hypothetical protein
VRPILELNGQDSFNILSVGNISEWIMGAYTTHVFNRILPLNGSCQSTILVHSSSGGVKCYMVQPTDTVKFNWAQIQDVEAVSGGAYFTATNSIDLGNTTNWHIISIPSQNFYWIPVSGDGSGNWSDPAHWSLTSGGTPGCAIPSRIDSVFFDVNSFTNPYQYCNIDVNAECKNMNWTNVKPGSGLTGSQNLNIFGSLKLDANMNFSYYGQMFFQATTTGNMIETQGKVLGCSITFQGQNQGTGEWKLAGDLTTTNWIYFYFGTFRSNGFNMEFFGTQMGFYGTHYVDFSGGTSLIKINYYWYAYYYTNLNMGSANILFQGQYYHYFISYNFNGSQPRVYNTITFDQQSPWNYEDRMDGNFNKIGSLVFTKTGDGSVYLNSYNDSIENVSVSYTSNIYSENANVWIQGNQLYYGNLNVSGTGDNTPKLYMMYQISGKKATLNNLYSVKFYYNYLHEFDSVFINGTCRHRVMVGSYDESSQAELTSSKYVKATNAGIGNIKALGSGTFIATNSYNFGNNTNWSFTSSSNNYYWVGGTGNWSDASHWALTSGGSGSGCLPTQADNVFFDVNSFTAANQVVTPDVNAYCHNMIWNGVNNPVFAYGQPLNIFGSLQIASNVTWNLYNWVYFQAMDNGNTINTNGVKLYYAMFNGNGSYRGEWTLNNDFSTYYEMYFRSGKFVSNGYRVSGRSLYNDYNDSRITLDFTGTDTIYANNEIRFYYDPTVMMSGTNIKFSDMCCSNFRLYGGNKTYKDVIFEPWAYGSYIYIDDNNSFRNVSLTTSGWPSVNIYGNNTFNDVTYNFNNSTTNIPTITYYNTNTFNNLSVTSTGNGGPYLNLNSGNTFNSLIAAGLGTRLILGAGQTQSVNSLLALGNGSFPVFVKSNVQNTQAIIYKPTGKVCLDFVLMQDINATSQTPGSTIFNAGASSVNLGNNTNWSFTSCNAFYWVGDNGNWSDYSHHWATSSGGTHFQTSAPGANDDVYFDANSFTTAGRTVTVDVSSAVVHDMKWGSAVFNPTLAGNALATEIKIYGDLELISGMNQNFTGSWKFMSSNSQTVNSANQPMTNVSFIGGNSGAGSWSLLNPLNVSNDLNFDNGILTTNNKDLSARNFNSTTSNKRTLHLGSSIVSINNGSWNPSTLTNSDLDEGTSTIKITGNGGTSNFFGNNLTYYNVTFTTGTNLTSVLRGANTFNVLQVDKGLTLNVDPVVQTMSNLVANGACSNGITIQSASSGHQAGFFKTSGIVNTQFLTVKDIKGAGGATWNANYSIDGGNNTSWNFTAPPTLSVSVSTTNVSCNSNNDGTATVTSVSGGITPYTYLWSTSETTQGISNLIPGNYWVKVTDSAGCFITTNFVAVNYPSQITSTPFTASAYDVCLGTQINFAAGTPPEPVTSYLWNFGDFTTSTARNPSKTYSSAGTYNVTLKYIDSGGCPAIVSHTIRVSSISASITSANVNCFGNGDGSISINASGGVSPYQYSINNGTSYSSSSSFTNLSPGTYPVKVKDSINCTFTSSVTISSPGSALSQSVSNTNVSCSSNNDGSITINASGGTAPYNYSINGGILYLSSNTFSNLTSGVYNVVTRDAKLCATSVQNITIGINDNIRPTITCPSDISVTGTGCLTTVSVPQPSAGDNCGIASVINNFNNTSDASGNYPLGATTVIWTATDVNNNVSTCSMTVTVNGPEINVMSNGNNISDGSTSYSSTNNTDFGSYTNTPITKTYTIQNLGSGSMTVSAISIGGANAADFSVTSGTLPATVAAGGNFTFNITFSTAAGGSRFANVTIANSDCDETYYDFAIKGLGDFPAGALNFDGSNDYVTAPSVAAMNFGTSNDFTYEAWVKLNGSQGNYAGIVVKGGSSGNFTQLVILNNKIGAEIYTGSMVSLNGTTTLNDGNWHHLALVVTRASNNAKLFVDGNLEVNTTNTNISGDVSNNAPLLIGQDRTFGIKFKGTIDEVRVWNRALCQGELQNNKSCHLSGTPANLVANYRFNQGYINANNAADTVATDASGNGNDGKLFNFALSGTTSNWVAGTVSGTCSSFTPPTATITSGSTTTCQGSSITLTANTGTGYSWQWYLNGSPISGATASTYAASTAGNYQVMVTVNGCSSISTQTTITVNNPPSFSGYNAYIQASTNSSNCAATVTYGLTASGSPTPAVTYVFTGATAGTGSGTGSGQVFNKGVTHVTVKATSSPCTPVTTTFDVTVVDDVKPVAKCKNITVYLDASGEASITADMLDSGSTDNCGNVNLSISNTGTICGTAAENSNVTLSAPSGTTITSIDFASYGTPTGACGSFQTGWCHASNSVSIVSGYAVGHNSATIPATNTVFGDPCNGTVKALYVLANFSVYGSSNKFRCANFGNNT